MRDSLDTIGKKWQTDKASEFTRTYAKPHDYLRHVEQFFEPIRDDKIKLLEIGIGGGESVRTWLEYFSNARVFGVDLVKDTNPWNSPLEKPDDRYTFVHGNQGQSVFWQSFIRMFGSDWDVVIDDGCHIAGPTITTYNQLWPHIKSGGIYEIEDLHSMPDLSPFIGGISAAVINGDLGFNSIYLARELCVIRKK